MATILSRFSASAPWLDAIAEKLQSTWEPVFGEQGPQAVKDALYGTYTGHPLHPIMTDVTIGAWTTSMIMDVLREDEASDVALKIGTATSALTALTGIAQWYDATNDEEPRRLGAAHASLNVAALLCYGTAISLRKRDHRAVGIVTAWAGHSLATASGWIGGDLAYRLGIGVDRNAFDQPIRKWKDTGLSGSDLAVGELTFVEVDDTPIIVLRTDHGILAASNTCTHLGGPLNEKPVDGTCVTCAWHGSVFDLENGRAIHGPATMPIPTYDTRISEGIVQIRERTAG